MSNLPAYIALARRVAERVGDPTVDSNIGCFLLGSTSPDVRIITRGRREEYRGRDFTWNRLAFMARRIVAGDDAHPAHHVADEFLKDMPDSLDRLYAVVSHDDLARFRKEAVGVLVGTVEDYLS